MIELREGRWQDVLPGTYDPATAVVITDPPFGLKDRAAAGEVRNRGYRDDVPWRDHVAEVLALLPAARHVIRGPSYALVAGGYPPARRMCVEVATWSPQAMPFTVPHRWHGWLVYGRLKIGRRRAAPHGDVVTVHPYQDDGALRAGAGHRAITPWQTAAWITELWTEPGWTVLDPFAGTGTIARAARVLGHAYIGAEQDPRWLAEARLAMDHMQPRLAL